MIIKLKIDLDALTLESDDSLVTVNELSKDNNILTVEISKPDPEKESSTWQ
jgi:hypothetical protein